MTGVRDTGGDPAVAEVPARRPVAPDGGGAAGDRPAFPFSAVVGQDALREALLVVAVDPAIGGVLVRGERGTAKTTAVRGLAPLLSGGRLVELPLGATADRVLGTLDLSRALGDGDVALLPGLLADADGGLLYVDEVNLLADHLVDVLLDAAATGAVRVERDGLSGSYAARFVLVGTMNPEEGDLRPQLLDRFGLAVDVVGSADAAVRVEVVRRRLAFDADPAGFAAAWAGAEADVARQVSDARARLGAVRLPDRMLLLIAGTCARLEVDGHRADIVCARAAVALAALGGVDEVSAEHVRRAARLALPHRRRRGPLQSPGLGNDELDEAMDGAGASPEPEPGGSGGSGGSGGGGPSDAGDGNGAGDGARRAPDGDPAGTRGEAAPAEERPYRAESPAAPHRVEAPDAPADRTVLPLALAGRGQGTGGRRSRSAGGAVVDARAPAGAPGELHVPATLRAAIARTAGDALRLTDADLREPVRAGREGNLVVFCVDASGSMGARRRMAAVKGAVLGLLTDAYQRRDRVALVTFRGAGAEITLPPTDSVERAAAALTTLPTGGGTPIAAGLHATERLIGAEARREPDRRALALLVTDGRASGGPAGRAAALDAAAALARTAAGVVVFDGEDGPVRLGLAGALADAAGAPLHPLSALTHETRSAA